jgi:hypothetical protein
VIDLRPYELGLMGKRWDVAADREGFHAIGIEQDATYYEQARAKITGDAPLLVELA